MRTSVIATQNINQAILIFLVISTFIFVAGAVYVGVNILPVKSFPWVAGLLAGMIILTAIFVWQPKVAMLLLILSVCYSPDIVIAQIPGRRLNLKPEDFIIVVAMLGLLIRYAAGREKISIQTPLDIPILIYCAVGLLSTLIGAYLGNVSVITGFFFYAKRVEYFVLFYLMYHYLEGKREIKVAINLLLILVISVSIYNVYMYAAGKVPEGARNFGPPGSQEQAFFTADIIILILPIILAVAFETRSRWYIVLAVICSYPMVSTLLDTLVRHAYLGGVAMLLFLAVYRYRFLLPMLAGVTFYASTRLPERVIWRIQFLWKEITQYPYPGGSLPVRTLGVKVAINEFAYSPLVGKGLGSYAMNAPVSHNQFTQVLIETGLLGLISFLWILFSSAMLAFRGIKNTIERLHRGIYIGYIAGLIGWLFSASGAPPFSAIRTMETFIIVMAIVMACVREDSANA
jgi:hypothetical protein